MEHDANFLSDEVVDEMFGALIHSVDDGFSDMECKAFHSRCSNLGMETNHESKRYVQSLYDGANVGKLGAFLGILNL